MEDTASTQTAPEHLWRLPTVIHLPAAVAD
jgi:hypothetical protein